MKRKTKQQLLNNWDNMVNGPTVSSMAYQMMIICCLSVLYLYGYYPNFSRISQASRKGWDIDLDISAPQIFLVEHFNDKNAILCVVDFGKLRFSNRQTEAQMVQQSSTETEVEEEEEGASNIQLQVMRGVIHFLNVNRLLMLHSSVPNSVFHSAG